MKGAVDIPRPGEGGVDCDLSLRNFERINCFLGDRAVRVERNYRHRYVIISS